MWKHNRRIVLACCYWYILRTVVVVILMSTAATAGGVPHQVPHTTTSWIHMSRTTTNQWSSRRRRQWKLLAPSIRWSESHNDHLFRRQQRQNDDYIRNLSLLQHNQEMNNIDNDDENISDWNQANTDDPKKNSRTEDTMIQQQLDDDTDDEDDRLSSPNVGTSTTKLWWVGGGGLLGIYLLITLGIVSFPVTIVTMALFVTLRTIATQLIVLDETSDLEVDDLPGGTNNDDDDEFAIPIQWQIDGTTLILSLFTAELLVPTTWSDYHHIHPDNVILPAVLCTAILLFGVWFDQFIVRPTIKDEQLTIQDKLLNQWDRKYFRQFMNNDETRKK
jgi:hypothetical protein